MASGPKPVWFSCSPLGTAVLGTQPVTMDITDGVATLSWTSTVGTMYNMGAGVTITYTDSGTVRVQMAPDRLKFDSGSTEILPGDRITNGTATGIVRYVEHNSGDWSGTEDAAGYIYFEAISGTFSDNDTLDIDRPAAHADTDVATAVGTVEGELHTLNSESISGEVPFTVVVKKPDGDDAADISGKALLGAAYTAASLSTLESTFTGSSLLNSSDLPTAGVAVFLTCFYDYVDDDDDTTNVNVSGLTTDADSYLHVYTPNGGAESFVSQRHDGKWGTYRYRLEAGSSANSGVFRINDDHIRVEGLCIDQTSSDSLCRGIYISTSGTADIRLFNNVFRRTGSGGGSRSCPFDISGLSGSFTIHIWNNISYDYAAAGILFVGSTNGPSVDSTFFNNTFVDNDRGIRWASTTSGDMDDFRCVNNICDNTNDDYTITGSDSLSNLDSSATSLSNDSTSPSGASYQDYDGVTNPPLDEVAYAGEGSDNFMLDPDDTAAKDRGTDLSSDAWNPIWRDIIGQDRESGTWDIGAHALLGGTSGPLVNRQALTSLVGGVLAQ